MFQTVLNQNASPTLTPPAMSLGVASLAVACWAAWNSSVAMMSVASCTVNVLAMYCQRAAKSAFAGAWKPSRNSSTKSGRLHTSTISQPASKERRARSLIPPTPPCAFHGQVV